MDQVLTGLKEAPCFHRRVTSHLHHPRLLGVGSDPGDMDFTGIEFDEEQDVKRHQPAQGPHFRAEKVRRPQDLHVGADEFFPCGGLFAIGSSGEAPALENVAHTLIADVIAQFG